ncbi:trypsin-like serine protease [Amycolatopsis sp. lyj-23]|uniref:trypsin-like serine protease n=1 Tax=Amycolatopsis sp. lyj-23 TaxID=2789283 RepID=UPI00397AC229
MTRPPGPVRHRLSSASSTSRFYAPPSAALALIGAGELCAGVPSTGGGVCNGDSGSGLLQRHGGDWYLLGDASRTIAEFCGSAAIYTNLKSYEWWINQQIHQLLPGAPPATRHSALAATATS